MTTTKKRCSKCKDVLPLAMFYRDRTRKDGKQNNCKPCVKKRDADYYATPIGNRTIKAAFARWSKTPAGKLAVSRHSKQRIMLYPEKNRAKLAVAYAVRTGKMLPASKQLCCDCQKPASDHHHYQGYAVENRLKVMAMCRQCHVTLHIKQKEMENRLMTKLDRIWKNQLRMSGWVAEVWREGNSLEALKKKWLKMHRFKKSIMHYCFFCEYAFAKSGEAPKDFGLLSDGCAAHCPGKQVKPRFSCCAIAYHFANCPKAFYANLLELDKKRRAK